jgi:hypothetical protein
MSVDSSIDELFSGGVEEPRRHRGSSRARTVGIRTGLIASCLTGVLWLLLRTQEATAPIPFLFLISLVIVLVFTWANGVRPPLAPRAAGRRHVEDYTPDGLTHVVRRWQNRLDWCHADAGAFTRKIQPQLAEIVDERLRQRHGIIRAKEPHRAARIVGEPLWTFLTTPVRRPPSPRELAYLIDQMEKI